MWNATSITVDIFNVVVERDAATKMIVETWNMLFQNG